MNRYLSIILFAMSMLLASCHGAGTDGDAWHGLEPGSPGFNEILPVPLTGGVITCEKNSDCTLLELGCCDSCNGGWTAAVNAAYATEVEEKNHESCNDDQICTDMACTQLHAVCEGGECVSTTEGFDICDTDDDCVAVEVGCCDHCNGGRVIAANRADEESVKLSYGEICDESTMCTLMACAPQLARCDAGRCVAYQDPDWLKPLE